MPSRPSATSSPELLGRGDPARVAAGHADDRDRLVPVGVRTGPRASASSIATLLSVVARRLRSSVMSEPTCSSMTLEELLVRCRFEPAPIGSPAPRLAPSCSRSAASERRCAAGFERSAVPGGKAASIGSSWLSSVATDDFRLPSTDGVEMSASSVARVVEDRVAGRRRPVALFRRLRSSTAASESKPSSLKALVGLDRLRLRRGRGRPRPRP